MKQGMILFLLLLITTISYGQLDPIDHTAPNADNLKQAAIKINANDAYLEGLANNAANRIDSLIVSTPDYDSIGLYPLATASGTDTYTATVTPAFSSYTPGQRFNIKFTNANTGAATININSKGAVSLVKSGSTALSAGDISAGQILFLQYDGTNMQVVGGADSKVDPIASTGTAIAFDVPRTYGYSADETGNITVNATGLKEGVTQLLIHNNSSTPTFDSAFKIISGAYVTNVDNYIFMHVVKSNLILVTISQEL